MLGDARYSHDEILAVIHNLSKKGGRQFSSNKLGEARTFIITSQLDNGTRLIFFHSNVLILGSGPSVSQHKHAIESFVNREKPLVVALNTGSNITDSLIDCRFACHPVRILADVSP